MKVINVGTRYEIHDDSLLTFDSLPAGVYTVEFNKMTGFYLAHHQEISVGEKVYGKHLAKVDKVFRTFGASPRNLGVILSGKKGIGKSLFAKLLSCKAVELGLPVILVERYIPGIASYIESVEQECVVMFDEYDKTFGGVKDAEGQANPQTEMLGLFDGMAQGKKLFVITCNDLYRLSDYLVNRPGRFHYHFRFEYPNEEEVREYLTDKLDESHYGEIDKVVSFAKRVDLNYDCLRAIAIELNSGEPFETAITDLNIVNTDKVSYNAELHFAGGYKFTAKDVELDLFDNEDTDWFWMEDSDGQDLLNVEFNAADCHYDMRGIVVSADALCIEYSESKHLKEKVDAIKKMKPEYLVLRKRADKGLHYNLLA